MRVSNAKRQGSKLSLTDVQRLGRWKAETLILHQWEPESEERRQAIQRVHAEAECLGISIDELDAAALPILERSNFFVHDKVRPVPPVTKMTLPDILVVWRAIWNNGGMEVDNRPYADGRPRGWEDWSGSPWVKARMEMIRAKGVPSPTNRGLAEAVFQCSFPPGREPETWAEREWADKYGRWLTPTEWQQPKWWDCEPFTLAPDHKLSVKGILLCWRGIYTNGGLRLDTTRYVPGSVPTWAQWSGSRWVQARQDAINESWVGEEELCLHLALPPGWLAELPNEIEQLEKYGRWTSETEWEPPPRFAAPEKEPPQTPTADDPKADAQSTPPGKRSWSALTQWFSRSRK
jgi:hypothetical protein